MGGIGFRRAGLGFKRTQENYLIFLCDYIRNINTNGIMSERMNEQAINITKNNLCLNENYGYDELKRKQFLLMFHLRSDQ